MPTKAAPPTTQLERVRVSQGLSRERLAAIAGLTARVVFNAERRGTRPHLNSRLALAKALGVDVDMLFPSQPSR